jgi:hypothetical protein
VFLTKKNSDFFHKQTTADCADHTDEVWSEELVLSCASSSTLIDTAA